MAKTVADVMKMVKDNEVKFVAQLFCGLVRRFNLNRAAR